MRRTAVVIAAALTAACAAPSSAGDPPPSAASAQAVPSLPAVPGIAAEAVRLRTDEAVGGRFQVRVTATGEEPFTVTSVALDSPGFVPLPAENLTAEFAPGRVIDLPTPYGDPVCTSEIHPLGARLTVARSAGASEEVVVPLGGDVLDRVHEEECAVLALGDVVGIAVTGLQNEGNALVGEMEMTRRSGEEPVTFESLERNVLLDAVAEDLPVTLADEERVSTPVSFTPASCDSHVLAEVKQPFVFPLAVRVGDDDPVSMDLPLDAAARNQLAALVDRVCEPAG